MDAQLRRGKVPRGRPWGDEGLEDVIRSEGRTAVPTPPLPLVKSESRPRAGRPRDSPAGQAVLGVGGVVVCTEGGAAPGAGRGGDPGAIRRRGAPRGF